MPGKNKEHYNCVKRFSFQDAVSAIDNWYLLQCTGSWEHKYGMTIETTDNPGWWLEMDVVFDEMKLEKTFLFMRNCWNVEVEYNEGNLSIFAQSLSDLLCSAGYLCSALLSVENSK
jgi:hypothetical protein